ncbi:MAG: 50S ribosomal protein L24 [Patescibacteria group bacterium]
MIRRNDTVLVITGKDRGKRGTVVRVLPKEHRIVIDGINMAKRHTKPSVKQPQGGIVDFPAPLSVSNVMIICAACNKPTRIAMKLTADGKVRTCKHCKAALTQDTGKKSE